MKRQRGVWHGMAALFAVSLLVGCSSLQPADPLLDARASSLPPACVQPLDGSERIAWLRAAAAVFEQQGFVVRATDAPLGLLSAERASTMPGLGAINGHWRRGGYGPRRGFADGLADPWWVFRSDPVRMERASLIADGDRLVLTRGDTVTESDGFTIDARPAATTPFCAEFFNALRARLDAPASRQEAP